MDNPKLPKSWSRIKIRIFFLRIRNIEKTTPKLVNLTALNILKKTVFFSWNNYET